MKTGKTFSFVGATHVVSLLIFMAVTIGCGGEKSGQPQVSETPFEDAKFNPFDDHLGKRIEDYNAVSAPNGANSKTGNPALYIDFSSGINSAFADPAVKRMMNDCFNTVLAQQFDVYKLGSNKIIPLNVSNTTELGQQVSNPSQYADIWAPIQQAVEKIVQSNNDALLITDFEEWQQNTEVTNTAFLKIPFSKWLEKGNTIHFFISDYMENGVSKHLYFTIFNCGNSNASSLLTKLEGKLGSQTTRFDLSTKAYELKSEYPSAKSGGLFYDASGASEQAKNVLDLKPGYINGLHSGNHFEFYPLGLDWKTINEMHDTYKSQGQFNDFFRHLFINLSNTDSYVFEDFEVKVSDVTNDFENFAKSDEAKNHKPKLSKGTDAEPKFADNETDPIGLSCYGTDGKLKEQWIYKPQPGIALNEVFTMNKPLFNNTKNADVKNAEFAVAFDPKFNIKNISNPEGLVKVDIVISNVTPDLDNAKFAKFQWINAKRIPNIALLESIKNTLQELKPANKVIYSYYLKTEQ